MFAYVFGFEFEHCSHFCFQTLVGFFWGGFRYYPHYLLSDTSHIFDSLLTSIVHIIRFNQSLAKTSG